MNLMKKSYRILASRYPSGEGVLVEPDTLNEAYKRIQEWTQISKSPSDMLKDHYCENYVRGLNFARVVVPTKNQDIVTIEIGTQITLDGLEDALKDLGLPFDKEKVRFE
jgi:hypothetical protein